MMMIIIIYHINLHVIAVLCCDRYLIIDCFNDDEINADHDDKDDDINDDEDGNRLYIVQ